MKTLVPCTVAVAAAVWIPLHAGAAAPLAAASSETPLQTAAVAWERGDYIGALATYLQLLEAPDAAASLEPIALQTGELYQTTELTADGSSPIFSPDGQLVAYETGTGLTRRTRIVSVEGASAPPLELPGYAAAFSADGARVAYLRVDPTGTLTAAQAAFDAAPAADKPLRLAALNDLIAVEARLTVHELATGGETSIDTTPLRVRNPPLVYGTGAIFFTASGPDEGPAQLFEARSGQPPVARTSGEREVVLLSANTPRTAILFGTRTAPGGRGPLASDRFGVLSLADGRAAAISGSAPAFSRDGASFTYVSRDGPRYRLMTAKTDDPERGNLVRSGLDRIDAPALSPDGRRVAFQMMPDHDWEIYVVDRDGTGEARVTRDIQHDVAPVFLTPDRLLAAIGEPRHRRSYLYDLPAMTRTRLFHNNTVRTIAPEYSWTPGPDGTRVLIAAERDGDTVSPARGVYLTDLTRRVTLDALRARVRTSLDAERALAAAASRMFAPIAAGVRRVVAEVSVPRIYGYEKALFDFDSKYVTEPGNAAAAAFLFAQYKAFGYEPEYQWFDYRLRNGRTGRTANVVATLRGTVNPDLIYVVSSHYDSVAIGPGADDDTSGTAALLETARILAGHPQPATIVFASFTGEEAGLLGSREFVRRAVERDLRIAGALNNDMIGWANDARLDNTIRYSNAGIRDLQHAAAMQFSNLITYDALYYKNTDAAAYYEAYGDIVGGIGSYPVLGNPHYHQAHDLLDGINHQLVAEVAKTTAASVMLLASSPSRLQGLQVDRFRDGQVSLSWQASPEADVTGYIVSCGGRPALRVARPSATVTGVAPGTVVEVKAVNAAGLEGWDWARVTVR